MTKCLISKNSYNGEVVYLNIDNEKGYKIRPKNQLAEGIKVNEMVFMKPELIKKIVKRKLKNKLEFYLSFIISDTDEDDARRALGDLQRYRTFVKEKYTLFLEEKYLSLLNNKFDILERNLKNKIVTSKLHEEKQIEEVEEYRRSR